MPADIPHRETVDAEAMILAIVAPETVIRNAVAMVTAALLPGAAFRLPVVSTINPPSGLLYSHLGRAPPLCGPVGLLLAVLLLLSLGLLLLALLFRGLSLLLFFGLGLLLVLRRPSVFVLFLLLRVS